MKKAFTVERLGLFRWILCANHSYSGYYVATFWTKRGAERAAKNLTDWYEERDEVKAREDTYEEALRRMNAPNFVTYNAPNMAVFPVHTIWPDQKTLDNS